MMSFVIPADIGAEKQAEVGALAEAAFAALDCSGFARCDFFLEDDGRVLVNEINTIPGMTAMSGFPRLWAATGVDGRALVEEIVQLGLRRQAARGPVRTCLLYTSDAADDLLCVDLGGRRIIKKKKSQPPTIL